MAIGIFKRELGLPDYYILETVQGQRQSIRIRSGLLGESSMDRRRPAPLRSVDQMREIDANFPSERVEFLDLTPEIGIENAARLEGHRSSSIFRLSHGFESFFVGMANGFMSFS